jgi:hypothetical protein
MQFYGEQGGGIGADAHEGGIAQGQLTACKGNVN